MINTMKRLVPNSLLLAVCLATSGCLALQFGGGSKSVESPPHTIGQELIDLKKALDEGALTEAEYQVQKERLLQREK